MLRKKSRIKPLILSISILFGLIVAEAFTAHVRETKAGANREIDAERIVVPGTAAREREGRTIPRSSFNAASARARPDQPSARMRDQPDISRLLQTLDETLRTLCESITCLDVASVETFHELLCRVRHALIQTLRLVEQRVHRERD